MTNSVKLIEKKEREMSAKRAKTAEAQPPTKTQKLKPSSAPSA